MQGPPRKTAKIAAITNRLPPTPPPFLPPIQIKMAANQILLLPQITANPFILLQPQAASPYMFPLIIAILPIPANLLPIPMVVGIGTY